MTKKLNRPRGNLRIRILTWSFVPTVIILAAVAFVILYAYQQVTQDLVAGKNRELARLTASQVATDLQEYTGVLSSLAQNPDIRLGIDSLQAIALTHSATDLQRFDGGVYILDNRGLANAALPPGLVSPGKDMSGDAYFKRAVSSGRPVFSDLTTVEGQGPEVVVAVPIYGDQDAFRGVIAGRIRVTGGASGAFLKGLAALQSGGTGTTIVVDSAGRVIYDSEAGPIGANMAGDPPVQMALSGQVGNQHTRTQEGEEILAGFAPVPGTSWGLVTEESWAALLAASQGYGSFLFLLLGLGVIVPALVVTFGVNRITDPILRLIAASKKIAGGQFGQQIEVRTGDELEDLATQFNLMSQELAESYGQLEERVAARTKELATLNAVAEVVSGSLNLKEIMNSALSKALETMQMEVGTAYALEEGEGPDEERLLVPVARYGLSEDFFQRVGKRRLRGTAIQVAAAAQRPAVWLVKDYPDPGVKQALLTEGVEQVVNVPLFAKGNMVGAFNVGTRHARAILPEENSLLASIGHQVAIAVENARLYDRAEQTAAMAERNRLSRELHDSVTQSLYSMTLYAEATARLLDAGEVPTATLQVRELRDTAQEALREMRLLIYQLRLPVLGRKGLAAALQERLDAVERRSGIQCRLNVSGEDRLPVGMQEELYHIAQEALNNALKHAQAKRISIDLSFFDGEFCLEIADDGTGFDIERAGRSGGMGLRGMRERAQRIGGSVDIVSSTGKGTVVRVQARVKEDAEPGGEQQAEPNAARTD